MSRKPLTGEAREAKIQGLLKEFPFLTKEKIEEWDKIGTPMKKGELAQLVAKRRQEPVDYSINPVCQDLLKSDKKASEKVTEMVNIYRQEHPKFVPPDDEKFMQHPSYLVLYHPIKHWFFIQCGSKLEMWTLLVVAAKEWFPDKSNTKRGHTFCVRFEIEDCTWWGGRTEFQPVLRDHIKWRYDREM